MDSSAQLSPPSPMEGPYGASGPCLQGSRSPDSPSVLCTTTFANGAWCESPAGSNAEPSPLRQPLKCMAALGGGNRRTGDVGHLVVRFSSADEVAVGPLEGKHHSSAVGQVHLDAPSSPRIRAQRPPQQQPAAQASMASESGSYIEWSLSSASVAHPSNCAEVAQEVSSRRVSRFGAGAAAAAVTCGPVRSSEAEEERQRDDGSSPTTETSSSSIGLPSRGHIIAPAANVRFLWSPSPQQCSPSVAETSSAGRDPLASVHSSPGRSSAASTPPSAQVAPVFAATRSPQQWSLTHGRRWEPHQHPIFGLAREDHPLAAAGAWAVPRGAVTTSPAGPALEGPELAAAEDAASGAPELAQAIGITVQPVLSQEMLHSPLRSPCLPPLHPSSSPAQLPQSSMHRRFHSALPLQGGSRVLLEGSALERAWSVTGSHIDIRISDSHASLPSPPPWGRNSAAAAAAVQAAGEHPAPDVLSPIQSIPGPALSSVLLEPPHPIGLPAGSYASALQQCKRLPIGHIKRRIQSSPTQKMKGGTSLIERLAASCLDPAAGRLRWRLGRQRLRLLALARMPFNMDDPLHYSLLEAVVTGFAGPGRAADGWREAGFSSANPSTTDLVGCGLLGLLHLLLLLERRPGIAAELHSAAAATNVAMVAVEGPTPLQEQQQQQQLMVSPALLSVHVTLWTVQALRTGLLARAAKRLESTTTAAECFYLGAMECFMALWKEHGGVAALQEALHRAELRAKSNVWPMIQRALAH